MERGVVMASVTDDPEVTASGLTRLSEWWLQCRVGFSMEANSEVQSSGGGHQESLVGNTIGCDSGSKCILRASKRIRSIYRLACAIQKDFCSALGNEEPKQQHKPLRRRGVVF